MRILTVCNLFPPYVQGGNEIRLAEILEGLRARHDVAVLTSTVPRDKSVPTAKGVHRELTQSVPYPEPIRGRTLFLGRELAVNALNYATTRRLIADFKPDVVYMSDTKRTFLGPAHAAQQAGVRVVWDITDKSLGSYRRRADLRRWVPWSHLDGLSFDHSIAISRYIRDALVDMGLLPTSAQYINQGVDLTRFGVDAPRVSGGPARRLLYVGSLIPDKGLHVVLRALSRLTSQEHSTSGGGYRLTVCGDSGDTAYKAKLAAFVEEHKLTDRVDFRGRVPVTETPTLYREHDAFIFSSLWPEPFATTPLEAMASGCPVIGTPVGGQKDFFRHEENCLTYAATSDFELAERVRSLADPARRLRLAVSALEEVRRDFDFSDYVRKIESVLVDAASVNAKKTRSTRRDSTETAPDSV
jgi:glycosyltransferase involved in cell wall biosynthesis